MCLGALLTGKALEVYSRIPLTLTNDFEHLKASLLNRFQMTCDDFRQMFFSLEQVISESPTQFLARLEHYLARWITLSGTDESFESFRNLILREQFVNSVPKDLSVFLRENATKDMLSLSDMATKYTLARTGSQRENKP